MLSLVEGMLARFDEELEQIKLKQSLSKNRRGQHSSREAAITHQVTAEQQDWLGCGLQMPDLLDQANFDYFSQWNGELRFVQNIKLKRVRRSDLQETMETL